MASEIKVDTIVNAGGDNDTGILRLMTKYC